ncbi:MAG: T9SS type B sorting domain-containing protein [Flavobacteriales bacterium]|nr:T9SS type B sorting domain-containing protein [Flavobacteriales bacterium]
MFRLLLILTFILPVSLQAQTEADWWYFGWNAGMHFTPSGPVADTNGAVSTLEGVATISDENGNLLFYSDGSTVYDANHDVMPNGTGLQGNSSSTQSAVIIKRPNSTTDYYLFSVKNNSGAEGLTYSRVDMSLNGGLGDVDINEKNIQLVTPTAEKIAAVPKPNGFWVITLKLPGDTAYAYEVTAAGVNTTAVTSNTGTILATSNFLGYLKPNLAGDKIAAMHYSVQGLYLYDFNSTTGEMSNEMNIPTTITAGSGYGVEFSPNGNLLYAGQHGAAGIYQYDLTAGSAAAISATEILIGQGRGALQLGPDSKIYCANASGMNTYVSRINDPNELGIACNYEDSAVYLLGRTMAYGLPTFLQAFFNASFSASNACFGDSVLFSMDTAGVDSVFWNFDDPSFGAENTSTNFFPSHLFTDTGSYTVMLIAKSDTIIDTAYKEIFIYPRQNLELGPDTVLCFGDTYHLNVAQPYSSYLWSDSSTAGTFAVWKDSTVYVTVFGVCDTLVDSVRVEFDTAVVFDLGPDTTFCDGNSIILDANITVTADVFWNTGDSIDSITVTQSGFYELNAINTCGPFRDTINVEVIPVVKIDLLPADTINCFDNEIVLVRPQNDTITFMWSDSSDSKTYTVDTTETVWLMAFNECGSWKDTMNIIFNGEIQTELGEDTTICDEDSLLLLTNDSLAAFLWNNGSNADSVWSVPGETFNYIVTVTLRDCERIEQKEVIADELACPPLDCDIQFTNVFTPNGDGINDRFRIKSDCNILSYSLAIYNRWGQLVHFTINPTFGWDGYINGEPASNGTYFYKLEYKDDVVVNVDRYVFQGSLTLKR